LAAYADYLEKSQDPLLPFAWHPRYAWFRMSLLSEFFVQVPAFVLGMYTFWRGASLEVQFLTQMTSARILS